MTGDSKEDWWEINGSMTIGPRPELRQEFRKVTGQGFYMYETSNFLKRAGEMLDQKKPVKEAAVKEIQAVHEERSIDGEAVRKAQRADWQTLVDSMAAMKASSWQSDREAFAKAAEAQRADWQTFRDSMALMKASSWQSDQEAIAKAAEAQRADWQTFMDSMALMKASSWQSDREALAKAAEAQREQIETLARAIKTFRAANDTEQKELPGKDSESNEKGK